MHEQPGARQAGLAVIVDGGKGHVVHHRVHVFDVREHNIGALLAQLQRDGHQLLCGGLGHQLAHLRAAGERKLAHLPVAGQRRPRHAPQPGNDVDDAGRENVGDHLAQLQRGERGVFISLQHHRVASHQRRSQLERRHYRRRIPGDNLPTDAKRLAFRQAVTVRDASAAVFVPHDNRGEIAIVSDRRLIIAAHFADTAVHIPRVDLRHSLQIAFQHIRQLRHHAGAGLLP